MLQSIAKIEEDPDFQSKKYVIVNEANKILYSVKGGKDPRAIPVKLKHPDNVLVVASPTSPAPPPAKGERRFDSLTMAMRHAAIQEHKGIRGCSVVVYPGLYIHPIFRVFSEKVSRRRERRRRRRLSDIVLKMKFCKL